MISSTVSRIGYPGAGSVGPFTFPFRIQASADLRVTKIDAAGGETTLAETSDYTVTGVGNDEGSITLVVALAVGESMVLRRVPSILQSSDFANQGAFFGATHERAFDRIVMLIQALDDLARRAPRLPEGFDPTSELTPQAGKLIGFDGTGAGYQTYTPDSSAAVVPAGGRTITTLTQFFANDLGTEFNVLDFGAIGDNNAAHAASNRIAIQAAIDAAAAYGPGGRVRIPAGNYKISGTINLKSVVTIVGDGMDATALRHTGGVAIPLLLAGGTVGAPLPKISIQDLAVYGDGTSTIGLSLSYAAYAYYRNVRFYGFATAGVSIIDSWNMVFDRCQAEYCYDGFYLSRDANNVGLRNCLAQFNTHVGYLISGARQGVLHDCDCESNVVGVRLMANTGFNCEKIVISGMYSEANSVDHIQVYSAGGGIIPRAITIRDVFFVRLAGGEAGIGIRVTDVNTMLIEGCHFSNDGSGMVNNLVIPGGGTVTGLVYGAGNRDESSAHESIAAGKSYDTQFASSNPLVTAGYRDGAGGVIVQATNKATAVALNTAVGEITMNAANLAAGAVVGFVFNNSALRTGDVLVVTHKSGGTLGAYLITATANNGAGNGQGKIYVTNISAGALAEAIVLQFAIIRGAVA